MLGISGSFGASGIKKYANVEELPISNVKVGTLAHVETNLKNRSALYIFNRDENGNAGWYKIATVNLAPVIVQGPDAAYNLSNDGSPIVIELIAEDPEGLPITWTATGSTSGLADIVQDGNTFTISASQSAVTNETSGSFELVFKATDGVSFSAAASTFSLQFAIGPADPTNLTILSEFSVQGAIIGSITSFDDYVITTSRTGNVNPAALSIHDITDLSNPSLVSEFTLPSSFLSGTTIRKSQSSGVYAVGNRSGGVHEVAFLDISDIQNPSLISILPGLSEPIGSNDSHFIIISTEFENSFIASVNSSTLQVSDSTSPGIIEYRGVSPRVPDNYNGNKFAVGVSYDDLFQPFTPELANAMQIIEIDQNGSLTLGPVFKDDEVDLHFFDGRYAYAKTRSTGLLQIWDCEDTFNPFKTFEESSSQSGATVFTRSMYLADNFLYVAFSSSSGTNLHVYEVSDKFSPVYLGVSFTASNNALTGQGMTVSNKGVIVSNRKDISGSVPADVSILGND